MPLLGIGSAAWDSTPEAFTVDTGADPMDLSNPQRRVLMLLNTTGAKQGKLPRGTRESTTKSLRRLGLIERIDGGWYHTQQGYRTIEAYLSHWAF
jgi:hypothetical protein